MEINFDNQTTYSRWIQSLDKRFGMPWKRELIILFGYMSSGKTEFAYFVARHNARNDSKVLFISLELPEYDMKLRIARKRAWVSKYDFQKRNYSTAQKDIMNTAFKEIDAAKNIIIESPENKNLWTIMQEMRKGYDAGYKMFIIDNLDKILAEWKEDENGRYQRITSTLQDFKNDHDACILLLHHAKKPDGRNNMYLPAGMSGMRGSQKIMDNATQVMEIYRDLDPDCPQDERNRVSITQLKDTFEWANWFVDIYFHKWEYVEENPNKVC